MQRSRTGGLQSHRPALGVTRDRGGEHGSRGYRCHGLGGAAAVSAAAAVSVTSPRAFGGVGSGSFAGGIGIGGRNGLICAMAVVGALGGMVDFFLFLFGGAAELHHDSDAFLLISLKGWNEFSLDDKPTRMKVV